MTDKIKIFIGTEPNQVRAERVLEYSIRKHTAEDVDITFMRAGDPGWNDWSGHGPTQFTLFRFAIPELMSFEGTAIYLDCDMLVLSDIVGLLNYAMPGYWVKHGDVQGDCVSVIDCACVKKVGWPTIETMKLGGLRKWDMRRRLSTVVDPRIPFEWNSMDRYIENRTRLVHFTALDSQPWHPEPDREYKPHVDVEACRLWQQYEDECNEAT